ncbi:MAG: selenide, water dikinase SelD [Dehalococcoidia bacterium]
MVGERRLTELASCAGCAGKAGADTLAQILAHMSEMQASSPDLLVGLSAPDDAAVYRLNDEQAVVLTVDFFAPLVDDPYDYGAISAANAMSDVYAMGGEVVLALNVAAFPDDMAPETLAQILRGGADKVIEAGGIVAGGHTIRDEEPKYGMCVMGIVHPEQIFTKGGARPGDVLYLTKALGTGIVTTAAKEDAASEDHLGMAVASMTKLNRHASHIAREVGVHAMTDVTGYSLLGHSREVATASDTCLRINAGSVPVLPGGIEYAGRGILTGGAERNRRHFGPDVRIQDVPADLEHILWDPQTSGALLMSVAREKVPELESRFSEAAEPLWRIGEVTSGAGVEVVADQV